MFSWIPGHVRAVWWEWVLLAAVTYALTSRIWAAAGVLVFFFGRFLNDQTVHLRQLNHANEQLTTLEEGMKDEPLAARLMGLGFSYAALWLIFGR